MCSPTNKLQLFRYFPQFGLMVLISLRLYLLVRNCCCSKRVLWVLKGCLSLLLSFAVELIRAHLCCACKCSHSSSWLSLLTVFLNSKVSDRNQCRNLANKLTKREMCAGRRGGDVAKTKDTLWQWRDFRKMSRTHMSKHATNYINVAF